MGEVVIIPFGYEDLPEEHRRNVTPICIEARDREGKLIDPVWFERGVAPISRELVDLAQSVLGDRRMASDIAQASVHKLWHRHGHDAGRKPYARIWRQALWEARDQAAGGWRERKSRIIIRTLEELDREFPEHTVDARDYAVLYHQHMILESIEAALREDGLEEMAQIYQCIKLGDTWLEIGAKLGRSGDAIKHRFYRFRKKLREII